MKTGGHKDSHKNLIVLGRRLRLHPVGYLLSSAAHSTNLSTTASACQDFILIFSKKAEDLLSPKQYPGISPGS